MRIVLERPTRRRESEFLAAVRRSRRLHGRFTSPASTPEAYRGMLARLRGPRNRGYFACLDSGELVGVVNLSEIVMGLFRSAYLGYYAFSPFQRKGYMKEALRLVVDAAFTEIGLHRVEANIQPGNVASRALVKSLGFRLEGYSPRYLNIGGKYRDHERWAITVEEWGGGRRKGEGKKGEGRRREAGEAGGKGVKKKWKGGRGWEGQRRARHG